MARKLTPVSSRIRIAISREELVKPKYQEGRELEWKDEDGVSHTYRITRNVFPNGNDRLGSIYCDLLPPKRPN